MQRTISRPQFPAVKTAGVPVSGCGPRRLPAPPNRFASICFALASCGCFVLASGGPASATEQENVLLDFTAPWCGPCQQMSSIVSRLERQGFPIRKVNVDQEPDLAKQFKVGSIPCFILVANGKELDRVSGATSEQQLRGMLNRLPKPAPAARTSLDFRSNPPSEPSLGTAIPITPAPGNSTLPRQALPPSFDAKETDRQPPADPGLQFAILRGNNPEPNPVQSSVRIRVKDGNAINYGSGTIIESQAGHATILTCGHLFRELSKAAVIEIDLFTTPKQPKPETVPGHVLLTDLVADVGLVRISHPKRLPTVPLGLTGMPPAVKDRLFSVGCSGGDVPSREDLELTGINRYDGPDNLECTRSPQQGRSGGGLFRDDELVGVCVAADPKFRRGIYTGLKPICLMLEKAGLTHLVPRPPTGQPGDAGIATKEKSNGTPDVEGPLLPGGSRVATTDDDVAELLARELGGHSTGDNASGAAQDFAGAEIICIVRSRIPGKPSRVVIVNQATASFVDDLLHESHGGAGRMTADRKPVRQTRGGETEDRRIETSAGFQPYRRSEFK